MATTEVISSTYTSTDGKSLTLGYDPSGNILVQATIQIDANFFQWTSVEDFNDFVINVIAMSNVINSPSKGAPDLLISPPSLSLAGDLSYNFAASGGTGLSYNFSIIAGTGAITSDGIFTAPDTTEIDIIKVTDSNNNIGYAFVSVSPSGINYIPGYPGSPGTDAVVD